MILLIGLSIVLTSCKTLPDPPVVIQPKEVYCPKVIPPTLNKLKVDGTAEDNLKILLTDFNLAVDAYESALSTIKCYEDTVGEKDKTQSIEEDKKK